MSNTSHIHAHHITPLIERGLSQQKIADEFDVTKSAIVKRMKKLSLKTTLPAKQLGALYAGSKAQKKHTLDEMACPICKDHCFGLSLTEKERVLLVRLAPYFTKQSFLTERDIEHIGAGTSPQVFQLITSLVQKGRLDHVEGTYPNRVIASATCRSPYLYISTYPSVPFQPFPIQSRSRTTYSVLASIDAPSRKSASNKRTRENLAKELRDEVLERDHHTCQNPYCCDNTAEHRRHNLTIDHIIPYSQCRAHEIDNLQVLCKACNCRKHTKSWGAFLESEMLRARSGRIAA